MTNDVNVKVAVRCRPLSSKEKGAGAKEIIEVNDGKTVVIRNPKAANDSDAVKQFTFDHSYFKNTTQYQVYEDNGKAIVEQALQGYNGTIFAYGQTGSGKTHTMMGTDDDIGVIPLMNADIFNRVQKITNENTKFLITVSFLEIYNEVVKDLLNPSDKVLKIREHPEMGIYVESLAELIVRDAKEVNTLVEQGNKVRQVAETQMNTRSSRSHSCFTINIGSKRTEKDGDITKEITIKAKINLVDLAGSERAAKTGATGDRLKEGAAINKSLSALGNVINMLADKNKKKHVPYRDSKLTRLLQESLGGNSLTVMIAAISPADYNHDESLSTLQYANRAKAIKNVTKKNEDVNEKIIRELREEIERLRQMVQAQNQEGNLNVMTSNPGMGAQMEEMIANLERAKRESWDEKQRMATVYEQERGKILGNEDNVLKFMQTVKEEKIDAIKRIKALQQEKVKISKDFRTRKEKYSHCRDKLQKDMEIYQKNLQQAEASYDPAREQKLQILLQEIEETREVLVQQRDALAELKEKQQKVEDQLTDEKAEMAAKSAVLQEDENLRQAIQKDEREKMEKVKDEYLKQALQEEREKMQQETEMMRKRLDESTQSTAMEKELELELIERREREYHLKVQLKQAQMEASKYRNMAKIELKQQLEELVDCFQEEKKNMELKYHDALIMLRKAKEDIGYLHHKNRELEKQCMEATFWEPNQ